MIEILPAPSHVAAFKVRETLTADDYDRCIAEIEARLSEHRRITVFCDLVGMARMTPMAVARDLRYAIGKLGQFHRFARGAIVTEREWLGTITRLGGVFFPHTDLRTFAAGDAATGFAWAAEPPVDEPPVDK
ncbi:MAG: STAS/SEC14 domain-containing protein [Pseudomonadota bacterium]|nr:STAS/SEC14 domain-containing protein [Pseudomonadota bacterium]